MVPLQAFEFFDEMSGSVPISIIDELVRSYMLILSSEMKLEQIDTSRRRQRNNISAGGLSFVAALQREGIFTHIVYWDVETGPFSAEMAAGVRVRLEVLAYKGRGRDEPVENDANAMGNLRSPVSAPL